MRKESKSAAYPSIVPEATAPKIRTGCLIPNLSVADRGLICEGTVETGFDLLRGALKPQP